MSYLIIRLKRKLRLLDKQYKDGIIDIGSHMRQKTALETEIYENTFESNNSISTGSIIPEEDSYFDQYSERLRQIFFRTLQKQLSSSTPNMKSMITYQPLLQDPIFKERITTRGVRNLQLSQENFPLSWSELSGLNLASVEKHLREKEIKIYCPFPLLTFVSIVSYMRDVLGYILDLRYQFTTMEGVNRVERRIEDVDVFIGSEIQAAKVLNNPKQFGDAVPVMMIPPGETPIFSHSQMNKRRERNSGIYFAQEGTSAQADIYRKIMKRNLNPRKVKIEVAEKIEHQKIIRALPNEAHIVSWEPLTSVFIDYLEPSASIESTSRLDYILFFSKSFVAKDFPLARAFVVAFCNAWYILQGDTELATDLIMSNENVIVGFKRLYGTTKQVTNESSTS